MRSYKSMDSGISFGVNPTSVDAVSCVPGIITFRASVGYEEIVTPGDYFTQWNGGVSPGYKVVYKCDLPYELTLTMSYRSPQYVSFGSISASGQLKQIPVWAFGTGNTEDIQYVFTLYYLDNSLEVRMTNTWFHNVGGWSHSSNILYDSTKNNHVSVSAEFNMPLCTFKF